MARRRPKLPPDQVALLQDAATRCIVASADAVERVARALNAERCTETELLRGVAMAVQNAATAIAESRRGGESATVGGFGGAT